jgi:predicted DNA-binding protein
MKPEREREMVDAIARAEEQDELEEPDRRYARPKPPRRAAGDVYTFRLPPERRDQLHEAAELRGTPPATLIREWIEARLDEANQQQATAAAVRGALPTDPTLSSGSYSLTAVLGSLADMDMFAEAALSALPKDELLHLAGLGSAVPRLAVALTEVRQRMESALQGLTESHDEMLKAISRSQVLSLSEIGGNLLRGEPLRLLADLSTTGKVPSPRLRKLMTGKPTRRHVVPNSRGGWDVRAPGSKRASSRADTQTEAIDRARTIVGKAGGGDVVVHGRDGKVRTTDTIRPDDDLERM